MKTNFFYEVYHYSLHVIKVFFGINSYYALKHHRRQKLLERMRKFNDSNHRTIDKTDNNDKPVKPKYPFPPHVS
jgi:hypothetical protein